MKWIFNYMYIFDAKLLFYSVMLMILFMIVFTFILAIKEIRKDTNK